MVARAALIDIKQAMPHSCGLLKGSLSVLFAHSLWLPILRDLYGSTEQMRSTCRAFPPSASSLTCTHLLCDQSFSLRELHYRCHGSQAPVHTCALGTQQMTGTLWVPDKMPHVIPSPKEVGRIKLGRLFSRYSEGHASLRTQHPRGG